VVEAEADIRRPAEHVFDYASDPADEPGWNIRMKRSEKLAGGPVGVGARYRMEFTQGPAAVSECMRSSGFLGIRRPVEDHQLRFQRPGGAQG
jgi:uncharacterized protein YndB with AHSA1/START domain